MCIIQGGAKLVADTKILVAPIVSSIDAEPQQFTVYCNKVSLEAKQGAMILPFPKSACTFFDLSEYKGLFDDLNMMWPRSRGGSTKSHHLEIQQVGSYKASVVPDIADFARLSDIFVIDHRVKRFIQKCYPAGYSFVVCLLDQEKEYHPFGYIHGRPSADKLFIPTMHFHQHSGRHVDWDHEIYTVNSRMLDVPYMFQKEIGKPSLSQPDKLPANMEPIQTIYGYKTGPPHTYNRNHDMWAERLFYP